MVEQTLEALEDWCIAVSTLRARKTSNAESYEAQVFFQRVQAVPKTRHAVIRVKLCCYVVLPLVYVHSLLPSLPDEAKLSSLDMDSLFRLGHRNRATPHQMRSQDPSPAGSNPAIFAARQFRSLKALEAWKWRQHVAAAKKMSQLAVAAVKQPEFGGGGGTSLRASHNVAMSIYNSRHYDLLCYQCMSLLVTTGAGEMNACGDPWVWTAFAFLHCRIPLASLVFVRTCQFMKELQPGGKTSRHFLLHRLTPRASCPRLHESRHS